MLRNDWQSLKIKIELATILAVEMNEQLQFYYTQILHLPDMIKVKMQKFLIYLII